MLYRRTHWNRTLFYSYDYEEMSVRLSVCPFVCLSVRRVRPLTQNEKRYTYNYAVSTAQQPIPLIFIPPTWFLKILWDNPYRRHQIRRVKQVKSALFSHLSRLSYRILQTRIMLRLQIAKSVNYRVPLKFPTRDIPGTIMHAIPTVAF